MGSPRMGTDGMVYQSANPGNSSPGHDVVDKKGKEPTDLGSSNSPDSLIPTGLSFDSFLLFRSRW